MTAKHTPGPWIINPYAERSVIAPRFATGPKAIAMLQGRIKGRDEIREANGRLISAAPDLLEALRAMVSAQHAGPISDGMLAAWKQGKSAIEKAMGGAA